MNILRFSVGSEAKRVAVRCVFAIGVVCWATLMLSFKFHFQKSCSHLFSQDGFVFSCIFWAPVGVPAVAGIPCRQRPNQPFLFAHFAHTLRVASAWILYDRR